ncbi:MAG: tRNA pseudouridine(38-40) synthase TruA [Gammaproteobacteria bacterium]
MRSSTRRYALGLEYDGGGFVGWQSQAGERAVQSELEAALSTVADEPVAVVTAGRTDAGVHASGQVAHFDVHCERSLYGWLRGANSNLPPDMAVSWVREVPATFHARYAATARSYRYLLCERQTRPVLARRYAAWSYRPLDIERMQQAADGLLGEHDFSAFRSVHCQAHSPVRTVRELRVTRQDEWVVIDVTANAFLYHMVRNLVGTLLEVGRGAADTYWPVEVLVGRDRRRAGPTAPAEGLTLSRVEYPESFELPAARRPFPPLHALS